jgi:hypothetical protein
MVKISVKVKGDKYLEIEGVLYNLCQHPQNDGS